METIDFEKFFLNISFDDILLNNNNPLINSYDQYIKYKESYLSTTESNYMNYLNIVNKLSVIKQKKCTKVSDRKIYVTILDKNEELALKKELKNLVSTQQNLLKNFLNYVNLLNENKDNASSRPRSIRSIRSTKSIKSTKSAISLISYKSINNKLKNVLPKIF